MGIGQQLITSWPASTHPVCPREEKGFLRTGQAELADLGQTGTMKTQISVLGLDEDCF